MNALLTSELWLAEAYTASFFLFFPAGFAPSNVSSERFFPFQTVANLIERRLFETKESKWVHYNWALMFSAALSILASHIISCVHL